MIIDYLVEVWDRNRKGWLPLIDFEAGLPLGKIIIDEYERLTLEEAQFRQAELTNRYPGLKFRTNKVYSGEMSDTTQANDKFGNSIEGALFGGAGNEYLFRDWAIPFATDLTGLLVEAGFDESLNYGPDMEAKGHGGNTMAFGFDHTTYVNVAVYVAEQIGAWAIGKFCDLLVKSMKSKLTDKGYAGRIRITIGFLGNLHIVIDSPAQTSDDADLLAESIKKVEQITIEKQRISKTTNRTLVYKIKDGSLPDEPIIIE